MKSVERIILKKNPLFAPTLIGVIILDYEYNNLCNKMVQILNCFDHC